MGATQYIVALLSQGWRYRGGEKYKASLHFRICTEAGTKHESNSAYIGCEMLYQASASKREVGMSPQKPTTVNYVSLDFCLCPAFGLDSGCELGQPVKNLTYTHILASLIPGITGAELVPPISNSTCHSCIVRTIHYAYT